MPLSFAWKKIPESGAFHDWENLTSFILRSAASAAAARGSEGRFKLELPASGPTSPKTVWPPSCVEIFEQREPMGRREHIASKIGKSSV